MEDLAAGLAVPLMYFSSETRALFYALIVVLSISCLTLIQVLSMNVYMVHGAEIEKR